MCWAFFETCRPTTWLWKVLKGKFQDTFVCLLIWSLITLCCFLPSSCGRVLQDQRLKEIGMHTPPSASPSSQSISSNNNNHITQTPELFGSTVTANRCAQTRMHSGTRVSSMLVVNLAAKNVSITMATKSQFLTFWVLEQSQSSFRVCSGSDAASPTGDGR